MQNMPPPPPPKAQLPPNWEEVPSGTPGEVYFWNKVTNETSWERPLFTTPAPPPPRKPITANNDATNASRATIAPLPVQTVATTATTISLLSTPPVTSSSLTNSSSTTLTSPEVVNQSSLPSKPSKSPPSVPIKPNRPPPSVGTRNESAPIPSSSSSFSSPSSVSSTTTFSPPSEKTTSSPSSESNNGSKLNKALGKAYRQTITSFSNLPMPGTKSGMDPSNKVGEQEIPPYPKWMTNSYTTQEVRLQQAQSLNGNFLHDVTFEATKELYREACLQKINRDGPQKVQFFLFNDTIAYADIPLLQNPKKQYELRRSITFAECEMVECDPQEFDKIIIKSPQKTFCVKFNSANEKQTWMDEFEQLQKDYLSSTEKTLPVLYAPLWVENKDAPNCHNCKEEFGLFTSKHHCRNCGFIFCQSCCNEKSRLPHIDSKKLVRTCVNCYREIASVRSYAVKMPAGGR